MAVDHTIYAECSSLACRLSGEYPVLVGVCSGDQLQASERFSGDLKSWAEIEAFVKKFSDKKGKLSYAPTR